MDESGFCTVRKRLQKVGQKGKKQNGAIMIGERGANTTVVWDVSATLLLMMFHRRSTNVSQLLNESYERSASVVSGF